METATDIRAVFQNVIDELRFTISRFPVFFLRSISGFLY